MLAMTKYEMGNCDIRFMTKLAMRKYTQVCRCSETQPST